MSRPSDAARLAFTTDKSQKLRAVSPELDRVDTGKVTMQTRVAVRDKTPHRFQVVPLREAQNLPSSDPPARTIKPTALPPPQVRPSRFKVHLDAQPVKTKKHASRTSKKLLERSVLQVKDMNKDEHKPKHRKAESLELKGTEGQLVEPRPVSDTPKLCQFVPVHGYSHSLNQYSFRLKPWKAFGHTAQNDLQPGGSAVPTRADLSPNPSISQAIGHPDSHESHVRTPTEDRLLSPAFQDVNNLSGTPCDGMHSDKEGDLEFAVKESPGGLRYANTGAYSFKRVRNHARKRHAIYELPDFRNLSSLSPDATVLSLDKMIFSSASTDGGPEITRSQSAHGHSLLSSESLVLFSSHSSGNDSQADLLCPIRPLNLVRNSAVFPMSSPSENLVYPYIICDLLYDLDEAIESWGGLAFD